MKADEFVKNLAKIAPVVDDLVNRGCPDDLAVELRSSFFIPKKQLHQFHENALIELLFSYDVASLEIGTITFHTEPIENEKYNYWEFGCDEPDPLIIDRETKEILLLDHGVEYFVMANCAENSEKFLDALVEVAKAINNLEFNTKISCEKTKKCAELAGGEKYLNFYQTLLGCYE